MKVRTGFEQRHPRDVQILKPGKGLALVIVNNFTYRYEPSEFYVGLALQESKHNYCFCVAESTALAALAFFYNQIRGCWPPPRSNAERLQLH